MRLDHLLAHQQLNRRQALRLGAAGAASVGFLASGPTASVQASGAPGVDEGDGGGPGFDDTMFDPEDVIAGGWAPSRYGEDDQRGTLNELTPQRVSAALGLLRSGRPVHSYQVGERVFNGFPAFPADPPRQHQMRLLAYGYQPPPQFVQGGGLLGSTEPLGPNLASVHEERFQANYTFQIATQLDGLGHVGVGGVFYNGLKGADLASPGGLTRLGNETVGPIVTRAVIYDVVGLKVARRATEDFFVAANGRPVLRDDYRITIADLRACLERQHVRSVGTGDIPIIHTGWTHLAAVDPERYLTQEPGIYLAEARYFAHRRVAAIASDTWGLEVLDPEVTSGNLFPCHQELFGKHGVRVGEGFVTDAAIADHVFEGVLVITPQNVPGATASSSPPVLLGQPGRRPRD